MKMLSAEIPKRDVRGSLAGKVAIVVGAGAPGAGWSNGSAVAAMFAREGASVFAIDRDGEAAGRTRDLVEALGQECDMAVADATDASAVHDAARACHSRFGRIDILYNNVGGGVVGGVIDLSPDEWDRALNFNLNTAFYASRAVLPYMLERRRGSIIHLASIAATAYLKARMAAYSAAKAGLVQMSRNIAMQHVDAGIRSNCILAGAIETAEIRRRAAARFGAENVEAVMAARNAIQPTGRSGTVWDIAFAALYLASDESQYVTATELVVDGGYSFPQADSYYDKVSIPERS